MEDKAKTAQTEADEKLREQASAMFDETDSMEGFEDMDQSVKAIPFVRIAQLLSPALNKNKPEYIEGLKEGDWYNTLTREIYGPQINVIVLKFEHIYIEWLPDRGGFQGYHSPENALRLAVDTTFGKWKTANGNSLQETYSYIVFLVGHEKDGPIVMSCASTALKPAKEFNRLMTTHIMANGKKAKPYYLVFNVKTEYTSKGQNSWYVPKFTFVKDINPEQYSLAKEERKLLPGKKIDYAQLEAPSEATDAGGEEGDF